MIFMFMELFKLLKQGDLFHFFLFKTSLPQFFHQAQDEAVLCGHSLGSSDFLKRLLFYLRLRPNLPSL